MPEKDLILMTYTPPEDWLGDHLKGYRRIASESPEKGITANLLEHISEAAGIFCLLDDPIPSDIIKSALNLKVISNMAVGVDNIDLATCTKLGVPVGHTPEVLTDGTADITLALLLSIGRQLPKASEDARQGRWAGWNPTGWL